MEQVAQISTHALLAEGDLGGNFALSEQSVISTHALLAEGDSSLRSSSQRYNLFQPTPSLRRATGLTYRVTSNPEDFNPRPPCGGRPVGQHILHLLDDISTHALLAEGDLATLIDIELANISTHALLAEGDILCSNSAIAVYIFQPTPSLRRATDSGEVLPPPHGSFQPTPSLRRATY